MHRSYKNPDFIYNLTNKELKDYYACYSHHHFNRKYCKSNESLDTGRSVNDRSCPCICDPANHYCTSRHLGLTNRHEFNASGDSINNTEIDQALIVCEHYSPSYTSKQDQINDINKNVYDLKKSKVIMKQTMKEIDRLLDLGARPNDDGLNEVERFYRSEKFIGSSMKISSLNKNLPRNDVKPAKHLIELGTQNQHSLYGNPLFDFHNRNVFADRDILENDLKFRKYKLKPRPMTSVILCKQK